ncbi:MAG: hypothetical protein ACHQ6T_05240 [Myxococcota bacterium]
MSGESLLFANLGAEEGETWPRMAAHARVRAAARLWSALFPSSARAVGGRAACGSLDAALARDAERAALELCGSEPGLVPWLSTDEAAELALRMRVPLRAAPPRVAAAVHDKAFALATARALGLLPSEFAETAFALAPSELGAADAVRCRIEDELAHWPAELRARFVLKPRFGTSGRGRLAGRAGRVDPDALRGALPRLRERGGCLVEPWVERVCDLSAQLWIKAVDDVRVLGTLRQAVTPDGVPLGHAGRLAGGGEPESGSRWEAELRAAALALGRAAAELGYTGPCGLDAFSFRARDGAEKFRAVVEWNARFTAGTSAIGLVARARRAGLADGASAFYVGFAPSPVAGRRVEIFSDDAELALWLSP